jgi:hypothetical protein
MTLEEREDYLRRYNRAMDIFDKSITMALKIAYYAMGPEDRKIADKIDLTIVFRSTEKTHKVFDSGDGSSNFRLGLTSYYPGVCRFLIGG